MSARIVRANLFRHLWLSSTLPLSPAIIPLEISLKEIEFNLIDEIPLLIFIQLLPPLVVLITTPNSPQAKPFKESKKCN